jgi:serine/threonine protein kinase
MLTGNFPFTGDSVRALAQRIKKGNYIIPQGLDTMTIDLIRGILLVDPTKRFTISQIKDHPAFRIGLEDVYVVPSPLPLPRIDERIELSDSDRPTIEILQQVGFADVEDLRKQLTADTPNMAKVFFVMLTQTDLESIAALSAASEADFGDPGRVGGQASSDSLSASLCESFMHATRFPTSTSVPFCDTETIYGLETHASRLMSLLQAFCRGRGETFLHPDDRTLIVVNQSGIPTQKLKATYVDERRMSLDVSLLAADEPDSFGPFFNDVKLAVADLIADPGAMELPPL